MVDRITAVFDTEAQAESAIKDLRRQGVADRQLSVVARRGEGPAVGIRGGERVKETAEERDTAGERAGKGALAGAGVGALFGLAAALIPGVGPFITAGWLASALGAVAGGAVSGAVVGGTAGAVAGALSKAGYSEEEAKYYGGAVERGGVMVAVDTRDSDVSMEEIRSTLVRHGGRFAGREEERRAA